MMLPFLILWGLATVQAQDTRPDVAAGYAHGVFLKTDGTVWTWGADTKGQLGRDNDDTWEPVQVSGLSAIRAVAAGEVFSLALKSDGTVWAWGGNQEGELGNGTKQESPHPAPMGGLPRIIAIAAASHHSMALDGNGTVWEWGSVPNRSSILTPRQVDNLVNVAGIAAGDEHSVALDRDGHVWVWGYHGAGDLGDGCYDLSYSPHRLPELSDITAVAGGYHVTAALRKDGTVWMIGYGAAGQLGNGSIQNFSHKPVMVVGLSNVKAIAAHYMNILAMKNDGTVWGWGNNHYHQLGNPAVDVDDSPKPVRAGTLAGVAAIASGGNYSAALTSEGVVWTWGDNQAGALGADPEDLHRSDTPMRPGQPIPPKCTALFACQTGNGKVIRVCGTQDESDIDRWTAIHYRFGPESGPPELMFPADPAAAPASLFFSEGASYNSVRFSSGGYTYRVYYSDAGAGVEVQDATGKRLSRIECAERPQVYDDYLRDNLPCDPKNARGAAGCRNKVRKK